MHVLLAVAFGIVIGLLLGAIGGGGSILTIPILVYAIGLGVHEATTTALVIVGVTALIGVAAHLRAGRVDMRLASIFGSAGIGGAFVGAYLNQLLPATLILLLFGALMLVVAMRMLRLRSSHSRTASGGAEHPPLPLVLVSGLAVGVLTGFFGVGGGFLIVPALVFVIKLPMRMAIGTSLMIIVINSAAALAAHLRYGGADLTVAGLFIVGGFVGSFAGSRGVGRIPEGQLARGFAVFVSLVGLYVIARNAGAILA